MDCGDFVVVTNAEQVNLTGDKWNQKNYYNHSQYPGGLRTTSAEEMKNTYPDRLVHFAVMGMLPKNKLRKRFLKKLKVYKDANHPHQAQKPSPLKPRIANGV
jgi:large subunit ribosomal protein L13